MPWFAALPNPFLHIFAEAAIQDHLRAAGSSRGNARRDGPPRTPRSFDRRDGAMVPLHDNFHAFLDLCQHGVWIASELGFANVERSHVYDDTNLGGMVGLNL